MHVMAINGSPRKKWNTATLLEHALAGAAAKGAQTEMIHLYDLNFKGCTSCFACKLKGGKSEGRCALKDEARRFWTESGKRRTCSFSARPSISGR